MSSFSNFVYQLDKYEAMSFFSYLYCVEARNRINNLFKIINENYITTSSPLNDLNEICDFVMKNKIDCVISRFIIEKNKDIKEINIKSKNNDQHNDERKDSSFFENRIKFICDYKKEKTNNFSINKEEYFNIIKNDNSNNKTIENLNYIEKNIIIEEKKYWLPYKSKNSHLSIAIKIKNNKIKNYMEIIKEETTALINHKGKYKTIDNDYLVFFEKEKYKFCQTINEIPKYVIEVHNAKRIEEKIRKSKESFKTKEIVKEFFDNHKQVCFLKKMNPEVKFWNKLIKTFLNIKLNKENSNYEDFDFHHFLIEKYWNKINIDTKK